MSVHEVGPQPPSGLRGVWLTTTTEVNPGWSRTTQTLTPNFEHLETLYLADGEPGTTKAQIVSWFTIVGTEERAARMQQAFTKVALAWLQRPANWMDGDPSAEPYSNCDHQ